MQVAESVEMLSQTDVPAATGGKRLRLMFMLSHPIQHYVKWCRSLASVPALDFEVFYAYPQGKTIDFGFRRTYKWDIDLYSGYKSTIGPAVAPLQKRFGWWLLLWSRPLVEVFRHDCVLMLGFTSLTGISVLLLKPFHRAKIVLRQDSAHFTIRKHGIAAWAKRMVYRCLLKSVDVVLVQGRQNADYFEYYGLPQSKHVFAPVVVDDSLYCLPENGERKKLRSELKVDPNATVFIVSGKFERRKRADFVIRAFAEHARANTNTVLWLVGSGEMDDELRSLVKDLGMNERVIFHGFVLQRRISELYKAADCLVHAARFDPWPICVLEAVQSGLAVILSSSVGSVDDIVIDGVTGFRFDENDQQQLTNHFNALGKDRALIDRSADACRRHLGNHSHQTAVNAVVEACHV